MEFFLTRYFVRNMKTVDNIVLNAKALLTGIMDNHKVVSELTFSKRREVRFFSARFWCLQDFKFHTVPATRDRLLSVFVVTHDLVV
jgi:hypothetical protein